MGCIAMKIKKQLEKTEEFSSMKYIEIVSCLQEP